MYLICSQTCSDRPFVSSIIPHPDDPQIIFTSDPNRALSFEEESSAKFFTCALNFCFDYNYRFTIFIK